MAVLWHASIPLIQKKKKEEGEDATAKKTAGARAHAPEGRANWKTWRKKPLFGNTLRYSE